MSSPHMKKPCRAKNPLNCPYHGLGALSEKFEAQKNMANQADVKTVDAHITNIATVLSEIEGMQISAGQDGASGHAIGSKIENFVYGKLKSSPKISNLFFPHDLLNKVLSENANVIEGEDRRNLFGEAPRPELFSRKAKPLEDWTQQEVFETQQSATADIIMLSGSSKNIGSETIFSIDVKSTQIKDHSTQAPNIISAVKLAAAMKDVVTGGNNPSFRLLYLYIPWSYSDDKKTMIFGKPVTVDLFKTNPKKLYINWTAGSQIQAKLDKIGQDYKQGNKAWAKEFLEHAAESFAKDQEKNKQKLETFKSWASLT